MKKNEGLEEDDGTTQQTQRNRDSKMKNRETKNAKNINSPITVITCY